MADPSRPVYVRRGFTRADEQAVASFRDVPTGFVVDAMGRLGSLDHRLKPITSRTAFAGSALTVQCRPWDNLAAHVALDQLRPGDVLAISTGGFEGASVIGEKLVGMARNNGAVAVVVDGMARDSAGIEKVGIPVFSYGVIANSSHKDGPGCVGLPVSLGGVSVSSGDILVGDVDGVVCIPAWRIEMARGRVAEILASEAEMFRSIVQDQAKPDKMRAVIAGASVHYLD
jgi:4-hydroxy-4-methyl-2-oxoglutarate aldolase